MCSISRAILHLDLETRHSSETWRQNRATPLMSEPTISLFSWL